VFSTHVQLTFASGVDALLLELELHAGARTTTPSVTTDRMARASEWPPEGDPDMIISAWFFMGQFRVSEITYPR
jgi:hypothetical protein